ncbi:hypothetical protein [Clostridium sp. UBA5712]|uniref:hypothetical protein n=1 Tax=Clostridium sp. UBA5712 TaxID=1946368 RepID=UPI003216C69C
MPSRKSYNRFFIILQEDQKGYGLDSNKTPSGYAKLEVRNDKAKASFYAQNLKKQKGPYFMILIVQGNNGNELINLGRINIDDGGKADVSNEFDANNLVNTNIGMNKVQGAAIGKISADKVMPVMVGFIGGEELKNWQNYPLAKSDSNTVKESNSTTTPVKETPKSDNGNMNKVVPQIQNTNLGQQESNAGIIQNNTNNIQQQTGIPQNTGTDNTQQQTGMPQNIGTDNTNITNTPYGGIIPNIPGSTSTPIPNINIPGITPTPMSNTRSDENYISDEVDIIDVEEIEPLVKNDLINEQLESNDEDYIDDENRIFEEYEKEIERLKDYRKKHSKKKNKYDDCKVKKSYDYDDIDKKCEDCKPEKHKKSEWNDKDYPMGTMGKFFKEVIYGLEKIGSNENIKNCFWYKAHVKKLEDMYCVYDYNKYSVVFYPMICYYPYISRHGNFMVGYKCDDEGNLKYIIYAIPGTRDLADQPYEGKTGFVTFMPDEDNDKTGHWLMYYDIKGNTVVVPVKR